MFIYCKTTEFREQFDFMNFWEGRSKLAQLNCSEIVSVNIHSSGKLSILTILGACKKQKTKQNKTNKKTKTKQQQQ